MGDGHFSPAGIDGVHTCLVLLSTHTAHIRAAGTSTPNNQHRRKQLLTLKNTDRRHSNLTNTRGV